MSPDALPKLSTVLPPTYIGRCLRFLRIVPPFRIYAASWVTFPVFFPHCNVRMKENTTGVHLQHCIPT